VRGHAVLRGSSVTLRWVKDLIASSAISITALADLLYPTVRYDDSVVTSVRPMAPVHAQEAKHVALPQCEHALAVCLVE
jgi:hypothetical protein